MNNSIKWGILGPGAISAKFAEGLAVLEDAEIVAVGSRSAERAKSFAEKFNVPNAYDNYYQLVGDPAVDVIYIGTPHNLHKEHTLLCLNAGKHVLVEKPFGINVQEARQMISVARSMNLLLMEAMWSRFLPTYVQIREWLKEGLIGDVRMLTANFGFLRTPDQKHRLYAPKLGGGALLDVGVYPVSLAHMVLGMPNRMATLAHIGNTKVDERAGIVLGYPNNALATLTCAISAETDKSAGIYGSKGSIVIPEPFWFPNEITLTLNGVSEEFSLPYLGNGYTHEAIEVNNLIRTRQTESDIMSHQVTLDVMQLMDDIRDEWGLKYPME